jgi:hypothetical protein
MEISKKTVPIDLFVRINPDYKITGSISYIDVVSVTIIEGMGKKRPKLIEDQEEIDNYLDVHSRASGKGSKSTIVKNVGLVSTCVSAAKTVVAATGITSLCAWMAGSYVSMKVSGVVKDQITTQSIRCRTFITLESVQHAHHKLRVLLECCDIEPQKRFVELLSSMYTASYLSSSDSSRSLSEKLKSTDFHAIISDLMEYIYALSPLNKNVLKNNGKRLFVAIINLAFDIHFKMCIVKNKK